VSATEPTSTSGSFNDRANSLDVDALRRRARIRVIVRATGLLLGAALIAAAIIYATRDQGTLEEVLAALDHASPWSAAALALCICANVALTGLLFSVLISRYGRVGILEMQALTAATALLNFLPLRPGLFGRVAYHRLVNGIAVADTAKVVVGSLVLTCVVSAALLGALVIAIAADASSAWPVAGVGALSALGLADRRFRWASAAFLIRLIDVLVWSLRYLIVFDLIGRPIGFEAALALSVISIFATLVPFISNGLGLREWAIGYAAPKMVDRLGGSLLDGRIAISAELVHRGMEIIVIGLCGGLGLLYLSARKKRIIPTGEAAMQPAARSADHHS